MKFTSSTSSLESPSEPLHHRKSQSLGPASNRGKKKKSRLVKKKSIHWKDTQKRSRSESCESKKDPGSKQTSGRRKSSQSGKDPAASRQKTAACPGKTSRKGQAKAGKTKQGKEDKPLTVHKSAATGSPRPRRPTDKDSSRKKSEREDSSSSSECSTLSLNARCARASQESGGSGFGIQTYLELNHGLKTTLLYDVFK